jgi:hypothetical protein
MPNAEKLEQVLNSLNGPKDVFRKNITDIDTLMMRVCDYAEAIAKRKRCEPWSIIGEITCHGSGVSSAIYELYRRREHP